MPMGNLEIAPNPENARNIYIVTYIVTLSAKESLTPEMGNLQD